MAKFVPKRFEQIFAQMIARVVARTKLSDVGDSAVMKHVLAAASRADDEQYYQMGLLLAMFSIDKATGNDLDERAKDIQPGLLTRILSAKATGTVVFSRSTNTGLTTNIPSGTKVKTASGQVFTTTAIASITNASAQQIGGHGVGRDAAPVAVTADVGGAAGNVATGTIIKFVSKPTGVDEVTNLIATLNGQDKESDDAFRARLKAYVAGLAKSTIGAIEAGLLGATDKTTGQTILYALCVEDVTKPGTITIYIDDGTGAAESTTPVVGENVTNGLAGPPPNSAVGGEQYLYLANYPVKDSIAPTLSSSIRGALTRNTHYTLNPANGQLFFTPALVATEVITAGYTYFIGLVREAQKLVDGVSADRTNYPGLRAGGILATVKTPQVLIQTVTASLVLLPGYAAADVRAAVKEAIKNYINSRPISGDVLRNEIIERSMAVAGVYDIILAVPTNNVVLNDDQLARTTDPNVTIT